MEFNVGDLVHVQSFGKGIILDKKQVYKETATTIYFVRLIDRDKALWFCSDSLVFASKGEAEEIMAGIRNKKIEIECGADDLYQEMLNTAKKMSNYMYGVGTVKKYGISSPSSNVVLRHYFTCFLEEVKDIKFSGPATIVFWKDGTKTVVKCQEGEHYDPKDGIGYALFKKIAGGTSNQASKMAKKFDEWLEKWIPEDLKAETDEPSKNEGSESHGSESTIMKATEETLGKIMEEEPTSDYEFMKEASDYLAEEMKKRLVGLGELADTVEAATDRIRAANEEVRKAKDLYFREHSNDKPSETEEK